MLLQDGLVLAQRLGPFSISAGLANALHRTGSAALSTLSLRALSTGSPVASQQDTTGQAVPPSEMPPGGAAPAGAGPGSAAAAAAAVTSHHAETVADYSALVPRIVVFGGSGYVGTRVCEQALRLGAEVVSISRHGRPTQAAGAWTDQVQWEKGDALDPQQPWRELVKGAAGVVSTLGTFGSNEKMYRVCGEANMSLMDAAHELKVPRFAFISVHDYQFPGGWRTKDFLLRGYFQGKRDAEAHLARLFPAGGVALRPGFIYGSRAAGVMTIPLGLVGAPLATVLQLLPTQRLANLPIVGAAFVPPVSVDAVGKAAAAAAFDLAVPPGPMDVWTIARYS